MFFYTQYTGYTWYKIYVGRYDQHAVDVWNTARQSVSWILSINTGSDMGWNPIVAWLWYDFAHCLASAIGFMMESSCHFLAAHQNVLAPTTVDFSSLEPPPYRGFFQLPALRFGMCLWLSHRLNPAMASIHFPNPIFGNSACGWCLGFLTFLLLDHIQWQRCQQQALEQTQLAKQ